MVNEQVLNFLSLVPKNMNNMWGAMLSKMNGDRKFLENDLALDSSIKMIRQKLYGSLDAQECMASVLR